MHYEYIIASLFSWKPSSYKTLLTIKWNVLKNPGVYHLLCDILKSRRLKEASALTQLAIVRDSSESAFPIGIYLLLLSIGRIQTQCSSAIFSRVQNYIARLYGYVSRRA